MAYLVGLYKFWLLIKWFLKLPCLCKKKVKKLFLPSVLHSCVFSIPIASEWQGPCAGWDDPVSG